MKSYTDLGQSKKLEEILPIESADMFYVYDRHLDKLYGDTPYPIGYKVLNENVDIPCWSLAALVNVMPNGCLIKNINGKYKVLSNSSCVINDVFNNSVDACYEMILKLNEQNLL